MILRDALNGPARPIDGEVVAYIAALADTHAARARATRAELNRRMCYRPECWRSTNGRLTYCCAMCRRGDLGGTWPFDVNSPHSHTDTCNGRQL